MTELGGNGKLGYLALSRVSIMAGDSLSTFARKLAFADNDVSWTKLSSYIIDRTKDRLSLL
jgi:hypothetical protein